MACTLLVMTPKYKATQPSGSPAISPPTSQKITRDVSQSRRAAQGATNAKASKTLETTAIPEAPPPTPGSTKQKVIKLAKLAKVGIIKIVNLTFREVGVCSAEPGCTGRSSEGWAGEISPEVKSLEVPAGVYKLKFGEHFLDNITVEAGETIVLEQ